MDGLTFLQTKGTPFGRGALNVPPMHELTLAIAACGLWTECDGPQGELIPYALRSLETCSRQLRKPPPPPLAKCHGSLPYQDSVTRDNCQSNRLLVGRQAGRFSPQLSLNQPFLVFMCASQGKKVYFMLDSCGTWALYKIFYKIKPRWTSPGNGVLRVTFFFCCCLMKTSVQNQPTST